MVPFERIQPTFKTLEEAREQFARLQDNIIKALSKAMASSENGAPKKGVDPGAQTLTFTNGPATLSSTSPYRYVQLLAEDGTIVLVPGFK